VQLPRQGADRPLTTRRGVRTTSPADAHGAAAAVESAVADALAAPVADAPCRPGRRTGVQGIDQRNARSPGREAVEHVHRLAECAEPLSLARCRRLAVTHTGVQPAEGELGVHLHHATRGRVSQCVVHLAVDAASCQACADSDFPDAATEIRRASSYESAASTGRTGAGKTDDAAPNGRPAGQQGTHPAAPPAVDPENRHAGSLSNCTPCASSSVPTTPASSSRST